MNIFKAKRIEKGISVKVLADAIGYSPYYIWKIEKGTRTPKNINFLSKLSDFYQCSIDDFIPQDSTPNQHN